MSTVGVLGNKSYAMNILSDDEGCCCGITFEEDEDEDEVDKDKEQSETDDKTLSEEIIALYKKGQ